MSWPSPPFLSLELHVSPSSVAPSARDFGEWLPQPSEHIKTLYLVDIREAEPVAVFKLHVLLLLLVIAVAVGVEFQPGGHGQVVCNAGNPRPRSVPQIASPSVPSPMGTRGWQGAEDNSQVDIVVL